MNFQDWGAHKILEVNKQGFMPLSYNVIDKNEVLIRAITQITLKTMRPARC